MEYKDFNKKIVLAVVENNEVVKSDFYEDAQVIVIPEGVKSIGKEALADTKKLENVIFLSTELIVIKERAFARSGLVKIKLPENIYAIETGAFEGCEKLTNVIISNEDTRRSSGVFARCPSLVTVKSGRKTVINNKAKR